MNSRCSLAASAARTLGILLLLCVSATPLRAQTTQARKLENDTGAPATVLSYDLSKSVDVQTITSLQGTWTRNVDFIFSINGANEVTITLINGESFKDGRIYSIWETYSGSAPTLQGGPTWS